MSKLKYFFLNGQEYFLKNDLDLTVQELINYFGYNNSLLVLEYNSLICNRKDWDKIILKNNDKIEIVTIVGGG